MAITLNGSASDIRTQLGLGDVALKNIGTGANNVVQLDGSGNLPAVDGSLITGLAAGEKLRNIYYTENNTYSSHSSTSEWNMLSSPSITPVDANSKFLVVYHDQIILSTSGLTFYMKVARGTTNISGASRTESGNGDIRLPITLVAHDAPSTTSAVQYNIRGYNQTSSLTVTTSHGNSVRSITVYEYDGS